MVDTGRRYSLLFNVSFYFYVRADWLPVSHCLFFLGLKTIDVKIDSTELVWVSPSSPLFILFLCLLFLLGLNLS